MPPRKAHRRSFGSVTREPSGRYRARYTGPDGQMRSVKGSFATKAEADARLAGLHTQMYSGTYRAPELGAVPFEEYALRWLDRNTDLAPRTHALYERLLRRWVLPALDVPSHSGTRSRAVQLGAYELRELSPPVVQEWFDAVKHAARISATGRAANASRTSDAQAVRAWARAGGFDVKSSGRMPRQVLDAWAAAGSPKATGAPMVAADPGRTQAAQAYRLLRAILAQAVREHLIAVNPCQVARAGHVRAAERGVATPHEVALIAAQMPPRYRAAVIGAAWSGLRASELFGLQRRHVDVAAGTVRVEQALVEVPGRPITFGPPKSDAGRRTVPLPPAAAAALAAHLAAFTRPNPRALVFGTENDTPLRSGARTKMFRRACAAIGRPDLRWHDLRHTGATFAAQAGATLPDNMRRMGHSSPRAALIYQHASDASGHLIAQRLGGFEVDLGPDLVPEHVPGSRGLIPPQATTGREPGTGTADPDRP